MALMPLVTLDLADHIATVTMRRTDRLNSLNTQMIGQPQAALEEGAGAARVVVLRAEPGVKVFSAGHDLDEVPVHADPHEWDNPVERLIAGIPALPAPVIAAVQGTVWGAACNLVVACDLVVATADATFAITRPARSALLRAGLSIFARSPPLHVVKACSTRRRRSPPSRRCAMACSSTWWRMAPRWMSPPHPWPGASPALPADDRVGEGRTGRPRRSHRRRRGRTDPAADPRLDQRRREGRRRRLPRAASTRLRGQVKGRS